MHYTGPPCIHTDAHGEGRLCNACRANWEEDATAWFEYGDHAEGIANWQRLQAEMNEHNT